jgi:protein involved in ribonucleotide reduction
MLQLVYDSMTGTVKRFTQQLVQELGEVDVIDACQQVPQREFLLLTYTFGTGEVPTSTRQFLNNHAHLLRGVVSSGSFHWGTNFARAADLISAEYHVPIVAKLNKGGTAEDRRSVLSWLRRMNGTLD